MQVATTETNLEQAIKSLRGVSIYANKTIVMRKKENVFEGLWVWCNPLLVDKTMGRMREVLSDDFRIKWFPNISEIHITVAQN
jgi:hypothetical protein